MRNEKKKGTIIVLALIYGTMLSLLLASVLNYAYNEYQSSRRSLDLDAAFHLAESGIERAIYALQYNELNSLGGASWTRSDIDEWKTQMSNIQVGTRTGTVDIYVEQTSTDSYQITALGDIDYGVDTVQKAIRVSVELIEDPNKPKSYYRPDFVFKDYIVLGQNTEGPTLVTSWDSTEIAAQDLVLEKDLTPQNKGGYTGYDAVIGSLLDDLYAIQLSKSWIYGSVGVAGDIPPQYERTNNANQGELQARLKGPDTPNGLHWDIDRVISDFYVDLPVPEKPSSDSYDNVVVYEDQNTWTNSDPIVIGELNKTTYVTALYSWNLNNKEITIQGDVFLYVDGAVNTNNTNTIKMNGEDSSLTIMSKGSMNFSGDLIVESRYPKQLLILQPENNGDIVIHTEMLPAFINAPNSNVRLHGTERAQGILKNYFCGGIVGKTLDHTNPFTLISDSSMRDQSSSSEQGVQTHLAVVQTWSEIPPSEI